MRYYLPSTQAIDWQRLLADPEKHWRIGYSARTLAHSWHTARGFPAEIARALDAAPTAALHNLEPLLGIPEHQVPLPGGSKPSQSDLWVLARGSAGLVSIAIEGKVEEPFGPTLAEWLVNASSGKRKRLAALTGLLEIPEALPVTLRYQLLHRSAAALLEAQRFTAAQALMLVHSFSPTNAWFDDFAAFATVFGTSVIPNQIVSVGIRSGVALSLGWVSGDAQFREM